jgi:hypothetical protein
MIADCAQRRAESGEFPFFLRTLFLQADELRGLSGKQFVSRLLVRRKLLKSDVRRHLLRHDATALLCSKAQVIGCKTNGNDERGGQ